MVAFTLAEGMIVQIDALAHAFLVVAALLQRIRHPPPPELIPLTCDEVSDLFVGLAARPLGHLAHRLRWSLWRRRQQARPYLPLSPPGDLGPMKITIDSWRIRSAVTPSPSRHCFPHLGERGSHAQMGFSVGPTS